MSAYGFGSLVASDDLFAILEALKRLAAGRTRKLGLPPACFDPHWDEWDENAHEQLAFDFYEEKWAAVTQRRIKLSGADGDIDGFVAGLFERFLIDLLRRKAPKIGNIYRRMRRIYNELVEAGLLESKRGRRYRVLGGSPVDMAPDEVQMNSGDLPQWERVEYEDETHRTSPIIRDPDLREIILRIHTKNRGWVQESAMFSKLVHVLNIPLARRVHYPASQDEAKETSFEEWATSIQEDTEHSPQEISYAFKQASHALSPEEMRFLRLLIEHGPDRELIRAQLSLSTAKYYALLKQVRTEFARHFPEFE